MADISIELQEDLVGTPAYRDLMLSDAGDLVLTSDADPAGSNFVAQSLTQRLRFLAGEWFLNTDLGVPYREQILGARGRVAAFEAVLQNTVLQTPGVISLLTWNTTVDRARRVLSVTFQAQTTSGLVDYAANLDPTAGSDA